MEIKLFISDDTKDSHIINFCIKLNKFSFIFERINNIKLFYNENKLFIFKENLLSNEFLKNIKKNIKYFSNDSCFLIPNKFNKLFQDLHIDIMNYPINIIDFENNLSLIFKRRKHLFKNLELRNDNNLKEIFVDYELGAFGNRKVAFVLRSN